VIGGTRRIAHGVRWRAAAIGNLYREANAAERLALTRYALAELRGLLSPRGTREAWIRLGGRWFLLALGRYEIAGYLDVWIRRAYEQVAGFSPGSGSLIVDVGANVGFYTIRHAARGASVVAVEPNPQARTRLEKALVRNKLDAEVIACAAGAAPGVATLVVGGSTLTGSLQQGADGRERHEVPVRTLDAILAGNRDVVDVLKLDTEGSERDILLGAPATLARTARVVMEFHSEELLRQSAELLARQGLRHVLTQGSVAYFGREGVAAS